jgi:transcriptional regulator with XRE-family HTH domain
MTNPYVSKVEHGRTNVTLSTMKKLAAAVSLEPSDMLKPLQSGEECPPPRSKKKPSL